MCGIIGIVCDDAEYRRAVGAKMLELLAHRGTQPGKTFDCGNTLLGCVRLPIVGGLDGVQPVIYGDMAIAFNGEIYNYRDLAPDMPSDTAACLRVIQAEGFAALARFRGMYAMIVHDRSSGSVWAARDPMGVKPLYVWGEAGRWHLASEIKCLAAAPGFDGKYLQVLPGHVWTPKDGMQAVVSPPWKTGLPVPADMNEAVDNLDKALRDSVRLRVPAGEKYAVLVSGGVDSSLIAAVANKFEPPLLIAVGTDDSEDVKVACRLAEHLNLQIVVRRISRPEVVEILPKVIWHLETPDKYMIANGLATYFAMQAATDHTRITLGGDGADELFAGYDYLFERFEPEDLGRALEFLLAHLGMTELMRLDRMSMAHAVEAREPFLDSAFIAQAMRIPVKWKYIRGRRGEITTKAPLRLLADRYLPDFVARRPKVNFFRGAGIFGMLESYAEETVKDPNYAATFPPGRPNDARTKLDKLCWDIYAGMFPQVAAAGTAPVVTIHPWFI